MTNYSSKGNHLTCGSFFLFSGHMTPCCFECSLGKCWHSASYWWVGRLWFTWHANCSSFRDQSCNQSAASNQPLFCSISVTPAAQEFSHLNLESIDALTNYKLTGVSEHFLCLWCYSSNSDEIFGMPSNPGLIALARVQKDKNLDRQDFCWVHLTVFDSEFSITFHQASAVV